MAILWLSLVPLFVYQQVDSQGPSEITILTWLAGWSWCLRTSGLYVDLGMKESMTHPLDTSAEFVCLTPYCCISEHLAGLGELSCSLCQSGHNDLISMYMEKGGRNCFLLKTQSVDTLISGLWTCKTCLGNVSGQYLRLISQSQCTVFVRELWPWIGGWTEAKIGIILLVCFLLFCVTMHKTANWLLTQFCSFSVSCSKPSWLLIAS